jgi:acyl carrier protein
MDMNNKTYEDIYSRTYSRIYNIVIEQFEVSEIPQPVLDFVIFANEYCSFPEFGGDEVDTLNFLSKIEEEFDIEIPDEVSEKRVTFKDLFEFVFEQKYNLEIAEYLEIRIKTKTLKLLLFLESKKIEISKFIEIFSSETFSNNHQNIEKLILSLRHKSFDVSSIISFSDIFKNDFLLSNLEQICQIYCFMNDQKISYFDVIDIIKSGYLDSCKQQIDDLSEKISLQESEIKKLSLQLEKANQNLDLLKGQLNHLLDDI